MARISIAEVGAILADPQNAGETYLIKFVRGTGRKRGSIKTVAKVRYGAPGRKDASSNSAERAAKRTHVIKGTWPLTDAETGQLLTPLISHIIGFNEYKVYH